MKIYSSPQNARLKGQAMVEFALMASLLLFMAFAAFEVSRYVSLDLRVASSVREAGRLYVAEQISANPEIGAYSSNYAYLRDEISNKVYVPTQQMIAPADLPNKGKMIVSVLRRVDPGNNTDYTNAATLTDDYINVDYQFIFPAAAGATNDSRFGWVSALGAISTNALGSNSVSTNFMRLETLRADESTVMIEIYHKTDIIAPKELMGGTKGSAWLDKVYDKAVF